MCSAIYANANSQGLLHSAQFAYRPGLSALLQLVDAQFERAGMINANKNFDVIYFDFNSAFETVSHDKLISLLSSYGVGSSGGARGTLLPLQRTEFQNRCAERTDSKILFL